MAKRNFFDLRTNFVFYASYHNTTVNIAIHLMCIWPILITGLLLMHYIPISYSFKGFSLTLPLIVTIIYAATYAVMEYIAGTFAGFLVFMAYYCTKNLVEYHGAEETFCNGLTLWQVALIIHVAAWILQFIGHGVFEGRAPALLDSLDQALLTAPLFVVLEILFFFGYRKDFYEDCMKEVHKNIKSIKKKS